MVFSLSPSTKCSYVPHHQIAFPLPLPLSPDPVSLCVPYNGQKLRSRPLTTLLRPFTSPNEPTRLVHLIAFLCSLCDTLCYLRLCIVPLFSVLNLKCFAGNRDLPLLDCL